ncbi:uncharacterized protein F5147DRAFT_662683 [Suillus discolor]|uniref:CSC1/OSCA1-like 7TM region domain-containing protein n=1 Tax=Suillus discolor TaxID=1912936 RepID=A0A9P7K0F3_9AGAM|nr:uncharacterized protein F5147DRAFT_662683 [Suillus discolor]KAG2120632.1 hypothetical protein F5147DRAFT_662683 [Suillus discolor]
MTFHADAGLALRPRRLQADGQSQGWSETASGTTHSLTPSAELPPILNLLSVPPNPGDSMFSSSPYPTVAQLTSIFVPYSTADVSGSDSSSHVFSYRSAAQIQPICIGDGLDSTSVGVIATVVLPTSVGLAVWLLFAVLRPRYRQIYALREWFVQQELRPHRLSSNLGAFLFPSVPLVPPIPPDVPDTGRSVPVRARLFPSDEELSQRTLWTCLIVVLGWSLVGLVGALPIYLVSTPCLAHLSGDPDFAGVYSTIQDLSLLRLLQLLEADSASTYSVLNVPDGDKQVSNARLRIVVLAVLAVFAVTLPALYKILKEINNLVTFRRRWLEVRCEGKEMGWLSSRKASGFAGWGEKRIKDHFVKIGLSSSLGGSSRSNNRPLQHSRQTQSYYQNSQDSVFEVDVQSLFTVCDTHNLAFLIRERDEILENLEVAETRYISSFKISTPDPSIADLEILAASVSERTPSKPHIGRPRALVGSRNRPRHRRHNPAQANSSFAPTSFVAPSQYYKLRGLKNVNGGRLSDSINTPISLTDSFKQQSDRGSVSYNAMPSGSHVKTEELGEPSISVPDPKYYGPNHGRGSFESGGGTGTGTEYLTVESSSDIRQSLDDDWIVLRHEIDFGKPSSEGPATYPAPRPQEELAPRRQPQRPLDTSSDRRETFPLRIRPKGNIPAEDVPPPHLRLQPRQPFVRPASDLNYDNLGAVYSEINQWRSRLKLINMQIAEAQQDSYADIADGAPVKGWIIIGRGLRHMHAVELIEGRAKEDVRWDTLQNETTLLDSAAFWLVMAVVNILLAAGLTAVVGLALSAASSVEHYLPFFRPLSDHGNLVSGLATSLAPAIGVALFTVIALRIIKRAAGWSGVVSVSGVRMLAVKLVFYTITVVVAAVTITAGALLFALEAFSHGVDIAKTVATGCVYMSVFAFVLIINVAVLFPGLMLLQPLRLWSVLHSEQDAVTPRQRFRAVYPTTYDASYAASACVLSMVFASAFCLIFPLIGPAIVILLFLALVAHRYLIGYVYARTLSETGGLLQIWLLKRLGTLLALQPLLLGLILLSRRLWIEGGILVGIALVVVGIVEVYTMHKTRLASLQALPESTQESLRLFRRALESDNRTDTDDENRSMITARGNRPRGSMASVLEMMSLTLAVMPSASNHRGPLPLRTETLDDLIATERAARTHPDAPPHLPALSFGDHAEEMSSIMYPPELLAPAPIIWLPNDTAGVAKMEAIDLRKYHDIHVTLDVHARDVILPKRSTSTRTHA